VWAGVGRWSGAGPLKRRGGEEERGGPHGGGLGSWTGREGGGGKGWARIGERIMGFFFYDPLLFFIYFFSSLSI
jgi:hypothetical protein